MPPSSQTPIAPRAKHDAPTSTAEDSSETARARTSRAPEALDIAVATVRSVRSLDDGGLSLVAERTLHRRAPGVMQYVEWRVGRADATAIVDALEHDATSDPTRAKVESYRRARSAIGLRITERFYGPDAPELYMPPRHRAGTYATDLRKLRTELDAKDAELLELRHARRLELDGIATVLERDVESVRRDLEEARERALALVGPCPDSHDGTFQGAILEAFSLAGVGDVEREARRRHALPLGTVIADRYELLEHLGAGAFADVYRARDRVVPDHVVALKIQHAPATTVVARETALRELRHLASVFHPSVVQLKDHGWHADRLWFVMPFYRGETLASRLARGPLTPPEARRIFEPLARGLAAMHGAGVRHQDIKPANIFLARLDRPEHGDDEWAIDASPELPVLLDLGVAAKEAELVLAGTPGYFAPEVAARFTAIPDAPLVTPKADVFSLALVLRNALEPSTEEIVVGGVIDPFVRHRAVSVPRPPVDPALAHLVPDFQRWLALSPDQRPSAMAFASELARLTEPAERAARRWRTARSVVPLALAGVVIFAASVVTLDREAKYQAAAAKGAREQARFESVRAELERERSARLRGELLQAEARRRALEVDIVGLEAEYRTSRLTREQLSIRLQRLEGELRLAGDDRTQLRARLRELADEIALVIRERDDVQRELVSTRRDLESATRQASDRAADVRSLREQLVQAEARVDDARARVDEMASFVDELRTLVAAHEAAALVQSRALPAVPPH